jgi:hypothetical protein
VKIPFGIAYPYTFGHDNIIIAIAVNGLMFCNPQTGERIDNFIDFDYRGRYMIGIGYDAEQEKYIGVWRETFGEGDRGADTRG